MLDINDAFGYFIRRNNYEVKPNFEAGTVKYFRNGHHYYRLELMTSKEFNVFWDGVSNREEKIPYPVLRKLNYACHLLLEGLSKLYPGVFTPVQKSRRWYHAIENKFNEQYELGSSVGICDPLTTKDNSK